MAVPDSALRQGGAEGMRVLMRKKRLQSAYVEASRPPLLHNRSYLDIAKRLRQDVLGRR